ncbi:xanthine dehydrogenase family protein subunit M [Tardiphaga alba]|uniref:Xanthine dehydrogenase family protein subunit M n=1 Tax=Tardiphaga alba TaxID=340268 RepID=A0ABX8A6V1_9BRAD|nr:xanthine dehydrogenase family protein subunit M [Tardiphaga alba]QUS39449.1 xanthine dehydrogenase family protein subunit M [Tardiphaga alba]
MNRYDYVRPDTIADAIAALNNPDARALAGGTNLVDLMKYDVAQPALVVDINRLPLKSIDISDGEVRIGALVSNSELAWHPEIRARWPLLSSAILAGASPQLRNAATTGGNLLQRTRCYYFYDPSTHCNKRQPGSGCSAIGGVNRIHAILGASDQCIAVHPSDMCVAMAALDATVNVDGPDGRRSIPFSDFHRLPGSEPDRDNTLKQGELITSVAIPEADFGTHHTYLKLRDRLSYAFALVSVAAAMDIENGVIKGARIALGGVAHKPWRDVDAERSLRGETAETRVFDAVAQRILHDARGQGENDFKIDLARRAVVRALEQAAAGTPQDQANKSIQ